MNAINFTNILSSCEDINETTSVARGTEGKVLLIIIAMARSFQRINDCGIFNSITVKISNGNHAGLRILLCLNLASVCHDVLLDGFMRIGGGTTSHSDYKKRNHYGSSSHHE
jgi:hypothetical protein